jgi:hypothetical protein
LGFPTIFRRFRWNRSWFFEKIIFSTTTCHLCVVLFGFRVFLNRCPPTLAVAKRNCLCLVSRDDIRQWASLTYALQRTVCKELFSVYLPEYTQQRFGRRNPAFFRKFFGTKTFLCLVPQKTHDKHFFPEYRACSTRQS